MRISDWSSDVCSSDLSTRKASSDLVIGGNELVEQAYAISGRALFPQRARLCRPYRSGNVEMRPFPAFLDKALDELRGRYRPAIPLTHILHVGALSFDLLVLGHAQPKTPQQDAASPSLRPQFFRQLVILT